MRVLGRVQDPNGQVQDLLQTVQIILEAIELDPCGHTRRTNHSHSCIDAQ